MGNNPPNSIIVYSAEAGSIAQDGVFTPTLLEFIENPGISFIEILQLTRRSVYNKTNGLQTPGAYDQLFEPVYSDIGGNPECDFEANGYRLPTEAEWEFAARGGNLSWGFLYIK